VNSDKRKWRLRILLGGLVVIALIINFRFDFTTPEPPRYSVAPPSSLTTQPQTQPAAIVQVKKEEPSVSPPPAVLIDKAAEKRAELAARYLNSAFVRRTGAKVIAVAVSSEAKKINHAVATALIQRFKTNGVDATPSVLKPAFVSDGLVNEALTDSGDSFAKLEPPKTADAFLLAQQDVQYTTNLALEGVITANMRLDVGFLPFDSGVEQQRWTFTANGAGFQPTQARINAEQRLLDQIAGSTNLVLPVAFITPQ
jgi:hypothetical protein